MGLISFIKSIFGISSKSSNGVKTSSNSDYYSQFLSDEPITKETFLSRLDNAFKFDFNIESNFSASHIDSQSNEIIDFCLKDGDKVVCCVLLLKHNENKSGRYWHINDICKNAGIPLVHFYDFYLNKEEYIKERISKYI